MLSRAYDIANLPGDTPVGTIGISGDQYPTGTYTLLRGGVNYLFGDSPMGGLQLTLDPAETSLTISNEDDDLIGSTITSIDIYDL